MKDFWIRMATLGVIVLSLVGYNNVLETRAKDEEIVELTTQLENSESVNDSDADSSDGIYKDGTYEGEAEGFGGPIDVQVIVSDGQINEINILSAENEDGAYLSIAQDIIPTIIENQTWDVDTISEATFSSTGIKNGVEQALEKAVN